MRAIEKIIGKKFERGMVPTGEQICEKQLFNLADRIEKVKVNEEEIAKYLPKTGVAHWTRPHQANRIARI